MKAKIHFTMVEKWFLKVLKVEYFRWHQLKNAEISSDLALRVKILTPEKNILNITSSTCTSKSR